MSFQTPWSQTLSPGSYRITVLDTQIVSDGQTYNFVRWQDQSQLVNPRTVTLGVGESLSLIAVYESATPQYITPYETNLSAGQYNITMPSSVQLGTDIYNFLRWEDVSTNPQRTITLDRNLTITATYELVQPVTYSLIISAGTGGTTSPAPAVYSIVEGAQQQVTAIPNTVNNYIFVHWLLDGQQRTENPITVLMNTDHTLEAVFEYVPPVITHTLAILSSANGNTEPAAGSYPINEGTQQQVLAVPNTDYRFVNWLLDGQVRTGNPITVLMNADHTLSPVFEYVLPPLETGTIQGIVKDAVTGVPLARATVTLNGYVDITEVDGSFLFENVPPKKYTLTVSMAGYRDNSVTFALAANQTVDVEVPLSAPIAPQLNALGLLALIGITIVSVAQRGR